jgi:hypothetical protein
MYSIRKGFKYQMAVMLGEFPPRNEDFFNISIKKENSSKKFMLLYLPEFIIVISFSIF